MFCSAPNLLPITASPFESHAMCFCATCSAVRVPCSQTFLCHAIARGHGTYARVAHKLGSILSSAYTHGNISLGVFRLCCVSIGSDTSEYEHQLVRKLKMKLKARGPFNSCQNMFNTLGRLESLATGYYLSSLLFMSSLSTRLRIRTMHWILL